MVLARFLGSLLTSIAVGLVWWRVGGDAWVERVRSRIADTGGPRWPAFSSAARHDLWDAGGWLVVGAAAAATLQVLVPRSLLLVMAADHPVLSVLVMGGLAVLLAICSEADAFVAASLREFSLTARLVFLVVGPAVDVKLIAMQSGVFGRRFAARFAPSPSSSPSPARWLLARWCCDDRRADPQRAAGGPGRDSHLAVVERGGAQLRPARAGSYLLASGVIVGLLGLLPPVGLLGQQTPGPAHGHGHQHRPGSVGCCWCRCWWCCSSSRPRSAPTRCRAGRWSQVAAMTSTHRWPPRSGARSRCRWPSSSPARSATPASR